jgi:DNA-nicking Smr family endonuclease
MGRRKPASEERPRAAAPESFNAPFAELSRELTRSRRRQKKARVRALVEAPAPQPLAQFPEPPVPAVETHDDARSYDAAMSGARPLGGRTRVPAARNVKEIENFSFDRIAPAEVARMDAADGFDLSYSDRFVRGRAEGVSRETVGRLSRGEFAVREHLDLHGLSLEDARHVVDDFLREHQERGASCVLVITGKGHNSPHRQGVLWKQVPEWLACGPSSRRVLAFVTARPCDGGDGALYVLLRARSTKKHRIDLERGGVGSWDN